MPPPIVSDTFEALEQLGGQMKQQTKQAGKIMANEAKKSLGLAPKDQASEGIEGGSGQKSQGQPKAQNAQIQQMEAIAQKKASQRYRQIQEQILAISHKKQQELPKEVTGKPGFSQEKMVQQLEEQKMPEAEKKADQREKEPIPLQRAKRKQEMHRGASG